MGQGTADGSGAPLLVRAGVPAVVAALVPAGALAAATLLDLPGRFNDFSSYWLAGRLVADGRSPYDVAALQTLGERAGLHFLVGGGYSYPPPFAVAMVPLAGLPFTAAAWLFSLISILSFGAAVGIWLNRSDRGAGQGLLLAALAGAYPPVVGSLYFGQANLLVTAILALSIGRLAGRFSAGRRGRLAELVSGLLLGLAGVVKLVPLVLLVPLGLGRRWLAALGLVVGAVVSIALAALLAPSASSGGSRLAALFEPDGFWSNQSLNGLATRLTIPTDRTAPLLPGLEPTVLGALLSGLLAIATAAALWRARAGLASRAGFSLAMGLVLIAGIAGAPKDSFWNHAPALVAVGLLVSKLPLRGRGIAAGLVLWYGLAWAQALVDRGEGSVTRSLGPTGSLVASLGLFGMLALWAVLARELSVGQRGRVLHPGTATTARVSSG